ncbi:MAG: hypothetical protein JKY92_03330 [Magnetovibrio sp.]|nr:hypothetical protein [Magnetovibrio sp.]
MEFWTIPFYMAAMYSIKDRSSDAFQLIQTIAHQEMLHVQLVANIGNAYGCKSIKFKPPIYLAHTIPHLDFELDDPDPRDTYKPWSGLIGPMDEKRLNAMLLLEFPLWVEPETIDYHDDVTEYGSIGAFYKAVTVGAAQHADQIKGNRRQVDLFSAYYNNLPQMTIENSGTDGIEAVVLLVKVICEQGEGATKTVRHQIEYPYQNTADDRWPSLTHFSKLEKIQDLFNEDGLPETYPITEPSHYSKQQLEIETNMLKQFDQFRACLESQFNGENPDTFYNEMASTGAAIQNCWKNGVLPKFA